MKPKIKYSAGEQSMLIVLRRAKRPLTTEELADAYYKHLNWTKPRTATQSVLSTLKGLINKGKLNRDNFHIEMTDARGPIPIQIQLIERSNHANSA